MSRPKAEIRQCVVGIDCDGVLSNFNKTVLDFIHREAGTLHHENDIKQWDILINFDVMHLEPKLDAEIEHNKLCLLMEPYEEPGPALFDLQVIHNADIHCVTAPYHIWTWPGQRTQWLQHHFGFTKKNIHHTHAKHMMNFDVFIDDSSKNCFKYASVHPNAHVFLWARSYNEIEGAQPKNLTRTNDWQQVIDHVHDFNNEQLR